MLRIVSFLLTIFSFSLSVTGQSISYSAVLGLNGIVPDKDQSAARIQYLKRNFKNCNIVLDRLSVNLNANGIAVNDESFVDFLKKLNKLDIAAVPIIDFQKSNHQFLADYYLSNYKKGRGFYLQYGDFLNYVELNAGCYNELNDIEQTSDSTNAGDNMATVTQLLACIKGFTDGVKSIDSSFMVAISINNNQYPFLSYLKKCRINYDFISCRWLNINADVLITDENYQAGLQLIKGGCEKPIWIINQNDQGNTVGQTNKLSTELSNMIDKLFEQRLASVFFIDENIDGKSLLRYKLKHDTLSNHNRDGGDLTKKIKTSTYLSASEQNEN